MDFDKQSYNYVHKQGHHPRMTPQMPLYSQTVPLALLPRGHSIFQNFAFSRMWYFVCWFLNHTVSHLLCHVSFTQHNAFATHHVRVHSTHPPYWGEAPTREKRQVSLSVP